MLKMNRSIPAEEALRQRESLLEQGWVEAATEDEARTIESEQGKLAFVDLTCGGKRSFSEEEMREFRETDFSNNPQAFVDHDERWRRIRGDE